MYFRDFFKVHHLILEGLNNYAPQYNHALWDTLAKTLPLILIKAIREGRVAAKFVIRCGLDTVDCLGNVIGTSVALQCITWIRYIGFSEDI